MAASPGLWSVCLVVLNARLDRGRSGGVGACVAGLSSWFDGGRFGSVARTRLSGCAAFARMDSWLAFARGLGQGGRRRRPLCVPVEGC